jgi:hypothetical protein
MLLRHAGCFITLLDQSALAQRIDHLNFAPASRSSTRKAAAQFRAAAQRSPTRARDEEQRAHDEEQ